MKNEGQKKQSKRKRSKGGHPCIICEKRIGRKIKFPGGSIYLCNDQDCKDKLLLKINDNALPVAQFSLQEFVNHEVVSEEIVKHFANDFATIKQLAFDVEQYIWSGETLGEMYHEAIVEAGQVLEKNYIAGLKNPPLHLHLMKELKSEAKALFECRLKGDPR